MQNLSQELRETICRHVKSASHEELVAVVVALTAELTELPSFVVPTVETGARFELQHDDQVVVDRRSGLMWSRVELVEKPMNWETADKTCRELKLAGYSDWRMPTVEELFALADRTRHEPAIEKTAFPECKSSWYWTSTPYAPSPGGCAWSVSFLNGSAGWGDRDGYGFVRAVRASQ